MAKTLQNFKENMYAGKVKISPEDAQAVRKVADTVAAHGDRYPEALARLLFTDTLPRALNLVPVILDEYEWFRYLLDTRVTGDRLQRVNIRLSSCSPSGDLVTS